MRVRCSLLIFLQSLVLVPASSQLDPQNELKAIVRGDTQGVIERLESRLKQPVFRTDTLLRARTLEMLGEQYYRLSDIDRAKDLWDEAYLLREAKFGANSAEMGIALGWRVRYHNYMSAPQWDHQVSAEEISVRAVQLIEKKGDVLPSERIMVLRERAYAYKVYNGIHSIFKGSDGPSEPSAASRPMFRQALKAAQEAGDTIWTAQLLHDIGNTFTDRAPPLLAKGDGEGLRATVDSATWYYRASIGLMTEAGLAASEPVMMDHLCLGLLQRYAFGVKGLPDAIKYYERALRVIHAMQASDANVDVYAFNGRIPNKAQVLELMSFIMHAHENLWLADTPSTYLDSSIFVFKAALPYWEAMLLEYDSERLHLVTTSYAHNPHHFAVLAYIDRYQHLHRPEDLQQAIIALERRRNSRAERQRLLNGMPAVEWLRPNAFDRLKAPPGTLVLLYFTANTGHVIVIDDEGPELLDLGTLPMDHDFGVGEFRELEVRNAGRDMQAYRRASHQLYRILLGPALHEREEEDLVIVPLGTMAHLPFEALLMDTTRTDARYVLDRYRIRYAPDLASAFRSRTVADPDLTVLLADPPGTSPLPFARRTAERLVETTEAQLIDNGAGAHLDDALTKEGILHVATHARSEHWPDGENHILAQDGPWSPPLQGVKRDLVVLAACSSGSGRVFHGEGAKTLGHSIVEAGAACVVHTLWPVDDRCTNEILDAMYEGLLSGSSPAEALQAAKKQFIAEHQDDGLADPFYWSGIVLLGDDVRIHHRSRDLLLPAGVAAGLLLMVLAYSRARRRSARSRN